MENRQLCIIDDDEIYQFTTKRMIELKGLTESVESFVNGEEALNWLKNNEDSWPDVIFLDINMPIMDGWTFLQELRSVPGNPQDKIDIYMVTSSSDALDHKKASEFPEIKEYIVKPFTFEKLKHCIQE